VRVVLVCCAGKDKIYCAKHPRSSLLPASSRGSRELASTRGYFLNDRMTAGPEIPQEQTFIKANLIAFLLCVAANSHSKY
jgi:hypothetical protein